MVNTHKNSQNRIFSYFILLLSIVGFNAVFSGCAPNESSAKPNIILILTDDQGWTDTSVPMMKGREDSKSDFYQTPNLERLADAGMVFSNAYAPAPVCSPTRYSILYGKTPARLRHATLNKNAATPEKEIALPKMIKAADPNYVTAHFGKWHQPTSSPEDAGYDESTGPTGNGEGDWVSPGVRNPPDDPKRSFSLSRKACEFMSKQVEADRPFFMQVSYYAVHVQNYALEKTKEKYRKMKPGKKSTPRDFEMPPPPLNQGMVAYAAMVEDLDTGFGMILDKIDALGIAENTYLIFTSDNGGGFRGNEPLQRGKADLWEGGLRVPTVVRGPKVPAGEYCDVPIAGWDFFPTISEIISNTNPLPENLDGGSLLEVFEKGNEGSVKRGEEALIFHFPWFNGEPETAIRMGDYKLIKNIDSRELWLFNLAKDIEESNNLAESMPEKTEALHSYLNNYLDAVDAEHVMDLRKWRLKQMVEESIPDQEQKRKDQIAKLKSATGTEKEALEVELKEIERHLNWLKGEVVFTKERSKLHEN